MIVTPDEGAIELLARCIKAALAVDVPLSMRLYKNDYTPVPGSVLASFTEATFAGYFRETITRATWPTPTMVGGVASSTYGTVFEWSNNDAADATLYGYYVVNAATGKVQWAERFGTTRVLAPSAKLKVQPVLTLTYQT